MTAAAYQDRYRRGTVMGAGYRACDQRYALVRPVVAAAGAGASVLDFGANDGYFAFRLAHELGVRALAVDEHRQLAVAAAANADRRVAIRVGRYTPAAVAALPHHDVVLALSVLHHNSDWRALLAALLGRARRHLVVETPHPDEPLREAKARHELAAIAAAVAGLGGRLVGTAPGVRSEHPRPLYVIRGAAVLRGEVFTGSGHCSHFWTPGIRRQLAGLLGYAPVPGSLNLKLTQPPLGADVGPVRYLLGPPHRQYWDRRRKYGGHLGGDYQFWRARFGAGDHAADGHVMLPGARSHSGRSVELVAPLHLRTAWRLEDGAELWVRVR